MGTHTIEASRISARIDLDPRWTKVPGVTVTAGGDVEIAPEQYFFRYEEPAWLMIDWERVRGAWSGLDETNEEALEQKCLNFIKTEARTTTDAGEVLENAQKVYAFLFREERLVDPDLGWVTSKHLQILRETSTMMALNRVAHDGRARNVGPAWFFPVCAKEIFDLTDDEATQVDELYHGGFFNESRRVEGIKAHTALGGRLVHGCQAVANLKGGAVVEYGTDITGFQRDLNSFAPEWMSMIARWRRI